MRHFMVWKRFDYESDLDSRDATQSLRRVPDPFATAQRGLANVATSGDIVWILTSLRFQGCILAPSLLARLQVKNVLDYPRPKGAVLVPDEQRSCYYPMNNIYDLLKSLTFIGGASTFSPDQCPHCKKAAAAGNRYSGVGLHFLRRRLLQPSAAQLLERHAQTVLESAPIFISYRWKDKPELAAQLVAALTENSATVWWDQWMMTVLTAKSIGSYTPHDVLSAALDDGLRKCRILVALVTSTYSSGQWTMKEWTAGVQEQRSSERESPLTLVRVDMGGTLQIDTETVIKERFDEAQALASRLLASKAQ